VSDEEDIALSILRCLCHGAAEGRFDKLENHDDLWRLLMTITKHKCVDQMRREARQKRGGAQMRGESALAAEGSARPTSLDEFVGRNLRPSTWLDSTNNSSD